MPIMMFWFSDPDSICVVVCEQSNYLKGIIWQLSTNIVSMSAYNNIGILPDGMKQYTYNLCFRQDIYVFSKPD